MKKTLLSLIFITLFSTVSFAEETVLEVISLSNRSASEVQPLLSPLLEITDQVIADGYKLIVKTTPDRLAEIKTIISQLDVRQSNLIITVIQSRQTTADDLNAAARAKTGHVYQTQDRNANESTQAIRTMEGNTAYIKTGNTYPIQNFPIYPGGTYPQKDILTYNSESENTFPTQAVQTYDAESGSTFPADPFQPDAGAQPTPTPTPTPTPGYGYPVIFNNTQFIETTTGFAVTPRLAGRQVVLNVAPWAEKMNMQNQIQTQDAQSTVRINLGEWIELGSTGENSNSSTSKNTSIIRQTSKNQMHILIKVDKVN